MPFPEPFYRWRPHPWHGLSAGPDPPRVVTAYIEITPFDLVKYEVDKATGYLKVDRPQRSSAAPPTLYGFIPRTYCASRVGALCPGAHGGDTDPLDLCVISERPINRAEVILSAKVVGGLQCIDHAEADDKIVAVLKTDNVWGAAESIDDLPKVLIERLRHYFTTYKLVPGQQAPLSVERIYDRDHAHAVVQAALDDYAEEFGA